GMHLAADEDLVAPSGANARLIADTWAGPVQLRSLRKSSHLGVTEGWHWSQPFLHGKPHRATQLSVRALFTAFFLTHLTGSKHYRELLNTDLKQATLELERDGKQPGPPRWVWQAWFPRSSWPNRPGTNPYGGQWTPDLKRPPWELKRTAPPLAAPR